MDIVHDICPCKECQARRTNARWTNNLIAAKVGSVPLGPTWLHLLDLYAALGVEWGNDPFAAIETLRVNATRHLKDVVADPPVPVVPFSQDELVPRVRDALRVIAEELGHRPGMTYAKRVRTLLTDGLHARIDQRDPTGNETDHASRR